jgi:hypothetical protein
MESERTAVYGTVTFKFNYKLTGAEARPTQYTVGKAEYVPDLLVFTLSASTSDGTPPSYDDLTADGATLYGHKLKKDGSIGLAETKEQFYSYGKFPVWIDRIIEAAALALREGV